ncbi:hypothetical protein PLESTM_001141100 [Pleodorina starrii]|nr:hypothetical protein PLESTM_001141100 [Pleodorina starrii]
MGIMEKSLWNFTIASKPFMQICMDLGAKCGFLRLRNGHNTEWLKECMDAFVKQFVTEGFQLQKPDFRAEAPKRQALTRKADLTNKDISSFFHMPIKDASRELGLSTTYLKRICRQLGIPRWPYRKVASLAFDAQ